MRVLMCLAFLLSSLVVALEARAQGHFAEERAAVEQVFALLDERLSVMPDVAAWKWKNSAPVRDPKREQVVIEQAAADAARMGLSTDAVRTLFQLQIDLASTEQARLHEQWRQKGFDESRRIPSLADEVRPRLDKITQRLLRALYLAAPALGRQDFVETYAERANELWRTPGWSATSRADSLAALARIRRTRVSILDGAHAAGVLRIGTTAVGKPGKADVRPGRPGRQDDIPTMVSHILHRPRRQSEHEERSRAAGREIALRSRDARPS